MSGKSRAKVIHVSFAGPIVRLLVNGRYQTFEMHRYLGPIKCTADGEPAKNTFWPEKSPFWPVFEKWVAQGSRVDEFGRGVVDE